jgi:predicted amidohydrolase YtcJ
LLAAVLVAGAVPAFAQAQGGVPEAILHYADIVLHNGKVITADDNFTIAQALAIRDGKILAVGTDEQILPLAGPKTEKVDLKGRSVLPGFIENHLHQAHVGNGATESGRKRLAFESIEGGLKEIAAEVPGTKPGAWIIVSSPRNKVFYTLTKADLDKIAPDNPLVIINMNEEVLTNSLGLKALNLPKETPGYIVDKNGEPTGHLARWASGTMIYERLPWPPLTDALLQRQKDYIKALESRGITTLGGRARGFALTIYNTLQRRGELEMRIRVAPEFLRLNANAEGFLKRIGNLVEFGNDMFKIIGATVEPVDGIAGEGAAYSIQSKIRKPEGDVFGDHGPNLWVNFGFSPLDTPKEMTEWNNVQVAAKYGWNITSMHSQGDKATEVLLDAYADANKTTPIGKMRFGVDHGLMQSPENIDKMKEMNVIPSIAAKYLFAGETDRLVYMYGPDAVYKMSPVQTLIAKGIPVTAESDILQDPYVKPLWQIEKFVTRTDEKGRVWNAQERISRKDALYMYTKWAALYHWDEKLLGTLEAGKLADIAVLNGDFMTIPEDQIGEMPVFMTIINGKIVFREGDNVPALPNRNSSVFSG